MKPFGIFDTRVRGFRVVELGGLVVLLILVLTVYLAKTGAGGKRADIDHLQSQIVDEQTQIRILKAEVATLEQPERLEALSARYLGLVPISARREVTPQGLADVAQVVVVDHKTTPAGLDPLTAVGSPDLTQAAGAPAPVTGAAPAPVATAPSPAVVAQAAPAPATHVVAKATTANAAPIKLAQAGAPPHAAARRAKAETSIDAVLQDRATPSESIH